MRWKGVERFLILIGVKICNKRVRRMSGNRQSTGSGNSSLLLKVSLLLGHKKVCIRLKLLR